MCGIVGVAGMINKKENEIFKDLLAIDVIRGPDSTGIASFTRTKNTKLFKKALLPNDMFEMKGCNRLFDDFNNNNILMGHNRWATVGVVNGLNAHPFELKDIVGAHNGTLRNKLVLEKANDFETDSEALFNNFQHEGVKKTIAKVRGAYALSWFDKENGELNFLRNDERPLFYCFSEDSKSFFWASEAWMLDGILARRGLKHNGTLAFEQMYHYTLSVPIARGETFEKFHMKKLKGADAPKQTRSSVNVSPNRTSQNTSQGKQDAGTNENKFDRGDICQFKCVNPEAQTSFIEGKASIDDVSKVRVYVAKGSLLREEMDSDLTQEWEGIVNCVTRTGTIIIQGNSVEYVKSVAQLKAEDELKARQNEEFSGETAEQTIRRELLIQDQEKEDNEDDWEAFAKMITSVNCAWCDDPLDPMKNNSIVSRDTIFCPKCRGLDEVKQFLPQSGGC